MENKRYTFFQAPFLSFFNSDLYRDVADNWKGCGALYIFLLSSAAWAVSFLGGYALPMTQALNNEDFKSYIRQVPHMKINDGKASIDERSPYEIVDSKTKVPMIRFDMNRKTDKMITGDPVVVVTSTAVISRESATGDPSTKTDAADGDATKTILEFSKFGKTSEPLTFDGESLRSLVTTLATWVPITILFVAWPFVYLGHLMQLLIYGGIGMLIASMMNKEINFEKAMRLSAIAISPAILLSTVIVVAQWAAAPVRVLLGVWWLISPIVTIVYLVLIIRALNNSRASALGTS